MTFLIGSAILLLKIKDPDYTMDSRTAAYYKEQAENASELYNTAEKGVSIYFERSFPAGTSVLDIGCGSGRDLRILLDMGYDACGIDSSPEMIKSAVKADPNLKERTAEGTIPGEGLFFNRKFECILCSAVLMHITDKEIEDAALTLKNSLIDGGRLLISVPVERSGLDNESRAPDGRLFVMRKPEYYNSLFINLGFTKTAWYEDEDSLGRRGVKWGAGLYTLESD